MDSIKGMRTLRGLMDNSKNFCFVLLVCAGRMELSCTKGREAKKCRLKQNSVLDMFNVRNVLVSHM